MNPLRLVSSFVLVVSLTTVARAQSPNIVWQEAGGAATAFSPDGSLVAASQANAVHLYRASDGSLVRTLPLRFGTPGSVAFSPDGTLLAAGTDGFNQNLWVFRVADATRLFLGTHANGTTAVAFSPDGKTLMSAGRDRMIHLWDVGTFTARLTINAVNRVTSGTYSHDGTFIVTGSQVGHIKLWRTSDGSLLRELVGHTGTVDSVQISHDGTKLVSGAVFESNIRIWNLATGALLQTITVPGSGDAVSVDFLAGDATVVAGTSELSVDHPEGTSFVRFWRVSDGALLLSYDRFPTGEIFSTRVSPDGRTFTFGDGGLTILAATPIF